MDVGVGIEENDNFNAIGTPWTRGNFNYDAATDIADFALLSANFNQVLSRQAPGAPAMFSGTRVGDELDDVEGAWARIA